jgi:hypothetical protein
MSAHGGSNSWSLSPSALAPPVWEVGLAGKRPKIASFDRVPARGARVLVRLCGSGRLDVGFGVQEVA